jgi:MYXO-CTERM domain-containing protein
MVMSGHDHYYEHGLAGNGVHYLISGGGGAPLYDSYPDQMGPLWPHEVLESMSVHNYQVIEVLGDVVHVVSHDVDHNVILDDFWLGPTPICAVPGDCIGEQSGSCTGDWECVELQCVWRCNPGPPCETADDCPPAPWGICPGHWECPFTEECVWSCEPLDECLVDDDCEGKDPLTGCLGGHYACEVQFAVCEWICPVAPTPDASQEPPDAEATPADIGPDPTDGEDSAADAEADADAEVSAPENPTEDTATPAPAPPPVVSTSSEASPGDRDSGGCAGGAAPPTLLWGLLGLAALGHRRRRCQPARSAYSQLNARV